MTSNHKTKDTPGSLLPKVLAALLSQDWLILLPDLYRSLRQLWRRYSREGMYEIIEYNSTLELLDSKGKKAIFRKQQRVKFLQDYINTFQDYAWGDGDIFADYQCTPGKVVDRYQEGDRWNILISLRETKNNGDITDFYIERTVTDGFTKTEEARQVEIRHHTRRLRLSVIFPKQRLCQRAVLLQRSRHRSRVLGPEHFVQLPDGRQKLTWETTKIRRFEIYTLKWTW
jgi:hypothetical protein